MHSDSPKVDQVRSKPAFPEDEKLDWNATFMNRVGEVNTVLPADGFEPMVPDIWATVVGKVQSEELHE
jgi:hypothetical protein